MSVKYNVKMESIAREASKNDIPITATIELVSVCNWKCKHCYLPEHNNYGLEYEKIIELIDELRSHGVYQIILTGGEIFLREDILDIIEYARSAYMRVNILSNASLITGEIAQRLAKVFIADYSLTIFSLDRQIHDSITGIDGSLKNALNGVKLLHKYGVPVEIKTPLLVDNVNEYVKVKEFCQRNGYGFSASPSVFPKSDGDTTPIQYCLNQDQMNEVICDIDSISDFQMAKRVPEYMCETLRHSLFISCSGDLYPCNGLYIKVGNVKENCLSEIWNSVGYRNLRNLKTLNAKECLDCELVMFCERCVGLVHTETNNTVGCSATCKSIALARSNRYERRIK